MNAEAWASSLPAVITLDDLAAMNHADTHGRRYELSTEGVLSAIPLPDGGHAVVASRLMAWLFAGGWPAEQILQIPGIALPGPDGVGGRIADLTLFSKPQPPDAVWQSTEDLLLVVEILSQGSEAIDRVVKAVEYAAAGIPRYWVVARDDAQTVTLHRLAAGGAYEVAAKVPLAWLLQTKPADHGLS